MKTHAMNSRGFTMIEILVALLLFSIILLPLTSLLVADSKFEKKYEQKQVALLVAKNELEKAKRTYRKVDNNQYQVTMAGRVWNVELQVKESERVTVQGTVQAPRPLGMPLASLDSAHAPTVIAKQFITIKVSRDNDSTVLAEFRVLKETYQ